MKSNNIPSQFELLGKTVCVKFDGSKFVDADGIMGMAVYRADEIILRPSTATLPITSEQLAQTFWHELTHFIMYHAGAAYSGKTDYMHQDEGFIDLVGSLLHQATSTFRYDHCESAILSSVVNHG
jgi:predicted SprT family Zn-dependent metalloprotease